MEQPLLQIELTSIDAVPKVFYKGEEIKGKVQIHFNWETDDDKGVKMPHLETNDKGIPILITISHRSCLTPEVVIMPKGSKIIPWDCL